MRTLESLAAIVTFHNDAHASVSSCVPFLAVSVDVTAMRAGWEVMLDSFVVFDLRAASVKLPRHFQASPAFRLIRQQTFLAKLSDELADTSQRLVTGSARDFSKARAITVITYILPDESERFTLPWWYVYWGNRYQVATKAVWM